PGFEASAFVKALKQFLDAEFGALLLANLVAIELENPRRRKITGGAAKGKSSCLEDALKDCIAGLQRVLAGLLDAPNDGDLIVVKCFRRNDGIWSVDQPGIRQAYLLLQFRPRLSVHGYGPHHGQGDQRILGDAVSESRRLPFLRPEDFRATHKANRDDVTG